jgi:uncharacterized membrane protein
MEGRFCAKCGASAGAAASPAGAPVPPVTATPVAQSMPMAENLAACLCYALTVITGVLFLILEPYNKNRNIRFHAFQAIFVGLAMIIGRIALSIVFGIMSTLSGWFLFAGISLLYSLACLILWVYLMLMAYQGKKIVLPVIGPLAQAQAG